jgi:hypothetical protein
MPSMNNLNTSLALEHAYFAKDIAELTASQINLPIFFVMLIIHFIASLGVSIWTNLFQKLIFLGVFESLILYYI